MAMMYRSSVFQMLDSLEEEQVDSLIEKVKDMIAYVEGGDTIAGE